MYTYQKEWTYQHAFILDINTINVSIEIAKWLDDNISKDSYFFLSDFIKISVGFINETDATAFRLVFG